MNLEGAAMSSSAFYEVVPAIGALIRNEVDSDRAFLWHLICSVKIQLNRMI